MKGVTKKARVVAKKVNKQAGQTVKALKTEWKKEQPHRKEYAEELKVAAGQALKDVIKIGSDVVKSVKKDISELNKQDSNK